MNVLNTDNLKQYLLIALILILGYAVAIHLYAFFPGLLGAITLYILLRQYYFHLTIVKSWKKWATATLFIVGAIVLIVVPLIVLIQVMLPKFSNFLSDTSQVNAILDTLSKKLESVAPQLAITEEQMDNMTQKLTSSVPTVLSTTANILINTVLAFFILYFMLIDGRKMEYTVQKYIPLKDTNIDDIWEATRIMVVSNAIGIPVLAASQAVVAMIGYLIFGVNDYILWGIVTGLFSLVPLLGTAIVWVPLCIYLVAIGNTSQGIGLSIFSLLITGSVDNVLRFTILKKIGDVHPIITALGIIVGVPLFGFMGFIFGPLLVSYLLLLIKIYRVEFSPRANNGRPDM